MQGTAYVFGDEVNTDIITPSDYFGESIEVMADHIFEPERPEFTDEFDDGDIVVAGEHFGSGSSRERAPRAIQVAGLGGVVAESFSRIFYRNAIAIGLPAITCRGITDAVSEGDQLAVDFEEHTIENTTAGERYDFEPLPSEIQRVFSEGGLVDHYRDNPNGLRMDRS